MPEHDRRRLISVVVPVFRDAVRAINAVRALRRLDLPLGHELEIVVVDDGSGDDTAKRIAAECGGQATILPLPSNRGRAGARNAGVEAATGEIVLFMDCDCEPVEPNFLLRHLAAFDETTVASCGGVQGKGAGFWHHYQSQASRRRERQWQSGMVYSGTSQNCAVRRDAFLAIGGFDLRYRAYGFEDRDLLIRLALSGHVRWAEGATVRHLDELSMRGVGRKMMEAGRETAGLFSQEHPEAYQALGYAAVDVRRHAWLRPLAWLWRPLSSAALSGIDRCIERGRVSDGLLGRMAKLATGLCYLNGTSLAVKGQRLS